MDDRQYVIFSDQYQMWLSQIMHGEEYSELFYILYNMRFTWPEWMPMDENRAADGQYLRVIFGQEEGYDCADYDEWPCSVLEMLVSFAMKIENQLCYDPDYGDRTAKWFWLMIENLGLKDCTDDWFVQKRGEGFAHVKERIDIFMDRKYRKDGVGGLFPLNKKGLNMHKSELWYQANWYMHEHYIRYEEV